VGPERRYLTLVANLTLNLTPGEFEIDGMMSTQHISNVLPGLYIYGSVNVESPTQLIFQYLKNSDVMKKIFTSILPSSAYNKICDFFDKGKTKPNEFGVYINTNSFGFMVDLNPDAIPGLSIIIGKQLKIECKIRFASAGIVCGVHAGTPKWLAVLIHAGKFVYGEIKEVVLHFAPLVTLYPTLMVPTLNTSLILPDLRRSRKRSLSSKMHWRKKVISSWRLATPLRLRAIKQPSRSRNLSRRTRSSMLSRTEGSTPSNPSRSP